MISKTNNPVSFSTFIYELDDAKGHLLDLIEALTKEEDYTEDQLRIDLGHIYAHLNRAWNNRNQQDDSASPDQDTARRFPVDLDPIA